MKLGQIVFSKAGRDSGRYYAVVEVIDENRVRIADGDLRRIKRAKLKNVRHLGTNGDMLAKIAKKLEEGAQVFDRELFSALRYYNDSIENIDKEGFNV